MGTAWREAKHNNDGQARRLTEQTALGVAWWS